jgi:hypothetical protein
MQLRAACQPALIRRDLAARDIKNKTNNMKKLILAAALLILSLGAFFGLQSSAPAPAVTGLFSTSDFINGTYPSWYTDVDTIKGTGTVTHQLHVTSTPHSIAYTIDNWHQAGTSSLSVTGALYGSGNNATTWITTPLTTFTITPSEVYSATPVTVSYVVNSDFGGAPMTDYKWVLTGTAGSTKIARSTVVCRK